MYPLENPNPHFLVGDACQVVGTTHEIVIKEVNCNTCQTEDKHQWSYSAHVPPGVGLKTAWYGADELVLVKPVIPHAIMRFQTRRVAMQLPLPPTQTTTTGGTLPPSGYPVGTVLHGTNAAKGNLWIITVDQSYQASLLFDGTTKTVAPDSSFKRDRMSPGMRMADPGDIASKLGSWKNIPTWAQSLILTSPGKLPLPKPSTTIPPQVIQQIQKQFAAITPQKQLNDLGLTKTKKSYWSDDAHDVVPSRLCPSRKEGFCDYQPYYGFTDTYMYCVHCDDKRKMPK